MELQHYLDDLLIEQPGGFKDLVIEIMREKDSHGIMFEASTSPLSFSGVAANYLKQLKTDKGLKASAIYRALSRCDDTSNFKELISGKLDFGSWDESRGSACSVEMDVEQEGCVMLFRNNIDQDVDMDAESAFDGMTAVEKYARLGFSLSYPAKEITVGAKGRVDDAGDIVQLSVFTASNGAKYFVRPTYGISENESIDTTQLSPSVNAASTNGFNDSVLSPIVLNEESVNCFSGTVPYSVRLKGSHQLVGTGLSGSLDVYKGSLKDTDTFPGTLTKLNTAPVTISSEVTPTFDQTFTGTTTIGQGEGFWALFTINSGSLITDVSSVTFDKETRVDISAVRACPSTNAKAYLIHEALSHITEVITNGCLKVRSNYLGRTDSQPYSAGADGCGSLRVINNGLQLRNGKNADGSNAQFFLSFKDAWSGLNPIDNLGYGIEDDAVRPGYWILRIEPVPYFYQNTEILSFPFAPDINITVDETGYYSKINTGYSKWEVENVNGLDEVHATRQFRTSVPLNNTLDIVSSFVAGSFAIEKTRDQNFAESGGADTKYDNETFITCVKRAGSEFVVDQGAVQNASNLFSPSTVYNWSIRPFANLMRWFKSIASSYANISDTDNRLFFSSGTGNYQASGESAASDCKIENGVKAENQDLRPQDFDDIADAQPLWRSNPIKFTYPLSKEQFDLIKGNPYGYISVQCGTGEYIKGFIDNIKYRPVDGTADFILREKWSQ